MGLSTAGVLAQLPIPTPTPMPLTQRFMFNFRVEEITKFQVSAQGKTVTFTKQLDGSWRADPRDYAAYEKNASATLQHLSQLEGGHIATNAPDMALYGLHAPAIVVAIVSGPGDTIPLYIGKPDPARPFNYFANNFPHSAPVYSISGGIVDELKGYLEKPAASPTPTKPGPSPIPATPIPATPTPPVPTAAPTLPRTFTPPSPPTQVTLAPPLPTLPPLPAPTPLPNFVEMLIQTAQANPGFALVGSGGCLLGILVFAIVAWSALSKYRKPAGQGVSGQPVSPATNRAPFPVPVASPSPAKQILNVGIVLQNRYQIVRQLGAGGMGSVYLARHLGLGGKAVAVKENLGGDPRQFQAEAVILANLNHPNLPRVLDHFLEPSGAQYLVMDYVAGQDLDSMVCQHGALAEGTALAWMRQVLDAVKYLHANRIVHRDIKPQNIIITPQGRAVLVDFGISKVMIVGQPTYTGARAGTPGYAPPEQYTGGTTEHSDTYSLGATFYYALTGQVPPESPNRAVGVTFLPPRQVNPAISFKTERVILTAMNLPVNQRYSSVGLMEQELNQP